jgi:antitoxin VapB
MSESDHGKDRPGPQAPAARMLADVAEIRTQLAQLPVLDDRSPEEIIGYDEFGLPS